MDFQPLPSDQVDIVHWMLRNIRTILEAEAPRTWTSEWLEILKGEADKGFHPDVPRFGFGDPTSYHIMEKAVKKLNLSGAVRHGAECFNFYFPQELDQQFLIV